MQFNAWNYKTQNGILKYIQKKGLHGGWESYETIRCLVEKWGWDRKQATRYCQAYTSFQFCNETGLLTGNFREII